MNKNAIQKYAIWARNELRDQITQKAYRYGITPDEKPKRGLESVNNFMLSPVERKQRDQLVDLVLSKNSNPKEAFDQMVEEVAYTWFNRLIALRFMEVNDYLPEHIRVLSSPNNEFKPEIISSALSLDEKHFNKDLILRLLDEGKQEELYRYLLLSECNALNEILPVMFEKMDGYTELLLPSNLLKADSVIGKLISDIDEADWRVTDSTDEEGGQVQIIGWLYQYYNSELKDQTFTDLKKNNKKISKERIPAATQLFTPDWIVRYMVENSLGRLWLEGHPNDELKKHWKYYIDETDQDPKAEVQLVEIWKKYSELKPEDLSVADIAMGSGHILVYAFDVLMQIYRSQGVRDRDAVKSILENNLYGLDIDDRAAQLAYFAVMMKAREYDRRIFTRGTQPNLFAIPESNNLSQEAVEYFIGNDPILKKDIKTLIFEMKDAKEYGSIINASKVDFDRINRRLEELANTFDPFAFEARSIIKRLTDVARILSSRYWVCCMNPPYMSNTGMDNRLVDYLKEHYPNTKYDLFSVFIERSLKLLKPSGFSSMITMESWMFLSSFQKIREDILSNHSIMSLVHFPYLGKGRTPLGINFGTSAFILRAYISNEHKSEFTQITYTDCDAEVKPLVFPNPEKKYSILQNEFNEVPGKQIAYWITENALKAYSYPSLGKTIDPRHGLATSDNDRFLKLWFEVDFTKTSLTYSHSRTKKWFPMNKGGAYKKWYGNLEWVINYENDGLELKEYARKLYKSSSRTIQNTQYYFKEGITWSALTSGKISFRWTDNIAVFGSGAHCAFADSEEELLYGLAFMNSSVNDYYLSLASATMNKNVDDIRKVPLIIDSRFLDEVVKLAKENILLVKQDWDSKETSWNFSRSPLLSGDSSHDFIPVSTAVEQLKIQNESARLKLKHNENRLNEIFKQIYNLSTEISSDVEDEYISIKEIGEEEAIKSLISYAVGTIFGRFSFKKDGINIAGGIKTTDNENDLLFAIDNIVVIEEDDFFENDLTNMFIQWIGTNFGQNALEDNLQHIADVLGGKGSSREIIRSYFLNDFFSDHCKAYKKRPIYWLFNSGKRNGFKCLIYMHRYTPDTLARIRTDYVLEQQERYRSQIKHLKETIDEAPKSGQVKMRKQLKDLEAKSAEVVVFEEKLHHLADQMIEIDLDDGVKHNYGLFQDVLAKIK